MAALALSITSCGSDRKIFSWSFDIPVDIPLQYVPGSAIPFEIPPDIIPAIPVNLKDYPQYVTATFDIIKEAKLVRLSFNIYELSNDASYDTTEPLPTTPDYFDFLNAAEIYIRANIGGKQCERLIAYVPEGDNRFDGESLSVQMDATRDDIHRYIKHDTFNLYVSAKGHLPPDDVYFDGRAVVRVTVGFYK
jgi:hypothetical protein